MNFFKLSAPLVTLSLLNPYTSDLPPVRPALSPPMIVNYLLLLSANYH